MSRHAFTLIELLVVVGIIAVIVAILLPALSMGQEAGRVAFRLANFREIGWTAGAYSNDYDPSGTGGCSTQPWFVDTSGYPGVEAVSAYVYGGHQHAERHPEVWNIDTYIIPTEHRPYNKYVAPGAGGRVPVKQFVCPSDNFCLTRPIGRMYKYEEIYNCGFWRIHGSSYAINWHWVSGAPFSRYDLKEYSSLGSAMLTKKVGGSASLFVMFIEGPMNTRLGDSRPPGLPPLYEDDASRGGGWHRKFSTYTMGFLDGHAEYRYLDTRYTSGPGYNIWPEPGTPWPRM